MTSIANPAAPVLTGAEPTVLHCARKARGRIFWTPTLAILAFHLGAMLAVLPMFFTWKAVISMIVLQQICGMGVTIGYHRLLTHRSFKAVKPLEYFLSWLGCLSLQGGPIKWVATHRLHHQHSDDELDPHSPLHGFFWSHTRWCCTYDPEFDPLEKYSRYAGDLAKDPVHVWIERLTPLSQVALAVALYFFGGWPCVIWAGCVRLVYVYHVTWLVNSATHTWGYRNFETSDDSRNLWWVALLSYGEGWHNNHHAYPGSARHGLKPWEIDISWMLIKALAAVGLVWDIRVANVAEPPQ